MPRLSRLFPGVRQVTSAAWLATMVVFAAPLAGCVVYEPYPGYYAGSSFDRAWNAALGGAQDAGVQVSSADPAAGLIQGSASGIDVIVTVARQADGSTRVQFD